MRSLLSARVQTMSDEGDEREEPTSVGRWRLDIVPGEMKAILREEHLCLRCFNQALCVVPSAIPEGMMLVVGRCGMFIDPGT